MKKIFCLLLLVISFTAVMAQSKNQQEENRLSNRELILSNMNSHS